MQVIVNINGRDALPVRAIPFVGRWGWMTSPDGVAEVFSQEPTRLHQTRDQMGSRAASVSVRNREALAAYTLEDKLVRLMSPSEWDYYKIQLDSLTKRLKAEERADGENHGPWQWDAIETLPAGVFVWLDEFQQWFSDTRPDILAPETALDDMEAMDRLMEQESTQITVRPKIPSDKESVVMAGFEATKLPTLAQPHFEALAPALNDYFDMQLDELPAALSMRIDFPWDALKPEQRRYAAKQWDYGHDPATLAQRERAFELSCELAGLRSEIRDWELLKPLNITEKAEKTDRLDALNERARAIEAQLESFAAPSVVASSHIPKDAKPTLRSTPESSLNGVIKKKILEVDWRLPLEAPPMQNTLDNLPKWVKPACINVGRVGKGPEGSHLWNPALLAVCLATKTPQKQWAVGRGALTSVIQAHFDDYLDQWEDAKDQL